MIIINKRLIPFLMILIGSLINECVADFKKIW